MSTAVTLTLDMRLGDQIIGELSFDPATEAFTVHYTHDWQQRGFPISPMIPLNGTAHSHQIAMFLVNLLPENKGLDYLIESLGVSRGNTFALIRGIGLDTAGAIAFSPKGTLDKDEHAFVADYRQQVVARGERYLNMASKVKAVEL